MIRTAILGMLAETPVHPGSGRGLGVVDLPVAREAATDYPVVVGSSLKGALKDKAEGTQEVRRSEVQCCFGTQRHAGAVLVADARLLLLPVRSLTASYLWATCPHLLERFQRDLRRAGKEAEFQVPSVPQGSVQAEGNGFLFLEERQFVIKDCVNSALLSEMESLIHHRATRNRLRAQVAILSDCDFAWFARYGLSVQARNVLDDKKRSTNLWYEETLPPDTVLYALIGERTDGVLSLLNRLFGPADPYLQVGGNETVGQGWFAVTVNNKDGRSSE